MAYDFHYTPTGTGVISGKEVLEQTEDAINDLGNTAISGVQEALDKAEQALTNSENAVDDAQTALNTANNAEGVAIQAQTDVGNLSGTVTNIGNRVTTAEGNISNLQGRMTTAEGNITNLQGRMTTAEGNIGNLQTAVSTAQATANSAQQTATTARQQSYVFRYSGTAITDNSTIAYSTIDNTDNIKAGDKILDVDGKLFEITAVDTTNQTVTVGSALIDLALDANVVHTSGNETVDGVKTFTDFMRLKSNVAEYGVTGGNSQFYLIDKNNVSLSKITQGAFDNGVSYITLQLYGKDSNNQTVTNTIRYQYSSNFDYSYLLPTDNSVQLGSTGNRWSKIYGIQYYYGANNVEFSNKFVTTDTNQTISGAKTFSEIVTAKINGLTPSSLGMPVIDRTKYVDISGYFTNTGNGDINTYSVTANGWIYLRLTDIGGCQLSVLDSSNNRLYGSTSSGNLEQLCLPVTAGTVVETQWTTSTSVTVAIARFIPCQGNI